MIRNQENAFAIKSLTSIPLLACSIVLQVIITAGLAVLLIWRHGGGFSVNTEVGIDAGDRADLIRLLR